MQAAERAVRGALEPEVQVALASVFLAPVLAPADVAPQEPVFPAVQVLGYRAGTEGREW